MSKEEIEMESKEIILQAKFARIIDLLSSKLSVSKNEAMDIFYNSKTAQLLEDGIADLHCRSDLYLVDEVVWEHQSNQF